MRLMTLMVVTFCVLGTAVADDPPKLHVYLVSEGGPHAGLPLAESKKAVMSVRLTAELDPKGEGSGELGISTDMLGYDEFGDLMATPPDPDIRLECAIKFVKVVTRTRTVQPRDGGPEKKVQEEWRLYSVTGPKVTSRLTLAIPTAANWQKGRLLIKDAAGQVSYAFYLGPPPTEPCHPGCFPAGTAVRTPSGSTPIERVCVGDEVTTVGADGKATMARVLGVFVVRNKLWEVRTAGGNLATTETQPLALAGGGYRPAGELREGDRVWVWGGTERRAAVVQAVAATTRTTEVFNLVLGDPTTFVAGDFLVRSKPPAALVRP